MSRSRDRHDVVTLREDPGQRELSGGAVMLLRDLLHLRDELEILLEILSLKARVLSPEIILGQIFDALDLAGEKSATKRAVRYEADIEETQRIEQSFFGIPGPERILGLNSRDGMHLVGAT